MLKKIHIVFIAIFFIISVLSFFAGFEYLSKILILQFSPSFFKILADFSLIPLLIVVLYLIIAYFFGRFYCSNVCLLGIFQDIIAFLADKKSGIKPKYNYIKYAISISSCLVLIIGIPFLLKYIEPYSIFSNITTNLIDYKHVSLLSIFFLIVIIGFVILGNRIFCNLICPVGTTFGLCSKFGYNKLFYTDACIECGACEKICPTGALNLKEKYIDNESCIRCLKCIRVCSQKAIKYGHQKEVIQFEPSRRTLIKSGLICLLLSGLCFKEKYNIIAEAKKTEDILPICPPGAISVEEFNSKCINCGLCTQHCKNQIIKKAEGEFKSVHLDYSEGNCDYNCKNCSEVCPTGALKKISSEQKKHCRIGLAQYNPTNCTRCKRCFKNCPTDAISLSDDNRPVIDETKCIGCGACENVCTSNSIKIIGVKKQKFIV